MTSPRIIIETEYSIERRRLPRRVFELQPQPDFFIAQPGLENAFLLANPHQPAQIPGSRRQTDLLIIRLSPELLIETATRLRLYRAGSRLLFRETANPISDDARLKAIFEAIGRELEQADAGWREMIRSSINQLVVHLLRTQINVQRSEEVELSRAGVVDRRLRRAIELMHDNCGRELSLAEIAGAAYLSEFHFARLFKKSMGVTPHAYLAGLRIERARRLLARTDLSIYEVGAQVGYGSQSHFTKVFREATGMTPRAFRLSLRSDFLELP